MNFKIYLNKNVYGVCFELNNFVLIWNVHLISQLLYIVIVQHENKNQKFGKNSRKFGFYSIKKFYLPSSAQSSSTSSSSVSVDFDFPKFFNFFLLAAALRRA